MFCVFHHGVLGVSRSLVFVYRPDGNFQLIIDTAKIRPQKRLVKCLKGKFLNVKPILGEREDVCLKVYSGFGKFGIQCIDNQCGV